MQHYPLIIGGEEIESSEKLSVVNPFNQEVFATINLADRTQLEQAIDKADKIFDTTRHLSSLDRADILLSVAQQLKDNADEFAKTIVLESGKPLFYAKGEVARCIDTFTIAAEEAKRLNGEFFSLDAVKNGKNRHALTKHFPEGPVLGISPFNFPLNLVAHKIAPALAVGAPIILKPSPKTPLSSLMLGKLIMNTDWPKEAISIVSCSVKDIKTLVEDPRIKVLSFTGSAQVGWNLKRTCGQKKVILELGGNAGVIVHSDANIDYAVQRCVMGSFAYSGQVCISVQRLFVQKSIFDQFVQKFKSETENLVIGDPLDPKTTFSAMVDEQNAMRIEQWVKEAVQEGAKVLIGGNRNKTMYPPTALTNVPKKEKLVCEEAFGPIVIIESYDNFSEAVKLVEESEFGLQAGIFTQDISRILEAYDKINTGGIMINDVPTFRVDQMPYGGNKNSGFGREGIKYSMEEYCSIKLLMINDI